MELRRLSIGYSGGKRMALFSDISATVAQGALIGLFGRNGIGKSTLLKTMAGLQPPIKGAITLGGRDLKQMKPTDIAKQIAFVSSQPVRTQRLSVRDMVGTGRYNHTNWIGVELKNDKEVINQALAATDLSVIAHQDSATLSDGELQRASIARSLAQDTPLIFLDEPTAFLDMGNRYKTIHLLKDLVQTAKKGVVFSTHDLTLALQVCDILWIMKDDGFYAAPPLQLVREGVLDALCTSFGLKFDPKTLSIKNSSFCG